MTGSGEFLDLSVEKTFLPPCVPVPVPFLLRRWLQGGITKS